MKLECQSLLVLGAISVTVRNIRLLAKKMYLRTPLPVPFLKQLSARFPHCWKDARPCCCTPGICHRNCLGRCGVLPKIEWVARSKIGQWNYVVFRHRHPKLRNRPAILVSLECRGPYQRNGASLIFMHCVVLEIQLFFRFHTPSYRKRNF